MDWTAHVSVALERLADQDADRAAYLLRRGSMRVGLYAPVGADDQTAHQQDELYIVLQGRAGFRKNGEKICVEPGSVLFVEAGAEHAFFDMEADFATWVVFWGPTGGESTSLDERREVAR